MPSKNSFSRRDFIKRNSIASIGIMTLGSTLSSLDSIGGRGKANNDSGSGPLKKITSIAGMSLEQLRDRYKAELFQDFLPNMDKYAIDHEYGGVMCNLDVRSGKLTNTEKTAWFVGRGLWVYSFLYNNLERNPHYLEIARKSKDLLLKIMPTDDSFWAQKFTREGKPLTGPGDIYGSLFPAEGLFEYAKASGEKEYRKLAKKIIFDCLARYDEPDYMFSYGTTGYYQGAPDIMGPRINGHWMIFLSLSTQMLTLEPDPDLEMLAKRCVNAIMEHHLNPKFGLINEVLNHDFSIPDNGYAEFSIVGHGLETTAFVMFEAARLKDEKLFNLSRTAFKKHVNVAGDAVYGGNFDDLLDVDKYTWSTGKALWCQQEVLKAALFLIENTNDDDGWAQRTFAGTDRFIHEKYFTPGNKFWYPGGDRRMMNPQLDLLEHYHHSRHLMLGLLSLERMIKRGGRVSGLFS